MSFDRGRMDDPNPSAFEQFDAAVARGNVTIERNEDAGFRALADLNEDAGLLVEKFADWCHDQGFAEGMDEAKMQAALGQ